MTPTARSRGLKFPVILLGKEKLDSKTIRAFLKQTQYELVLVGNKDVPVLYNGETDDEPLDMIESFGQLGWPDDFMNEINQKPGVNGKAFVILDSTSGQDQSTCLVAASVGDDNPTIDHAKFRCQFSSTLSVLAQLDRGGPADIPHIIRRLRTEAAEAGAVWEMALVDRIKSREAQIGLSKFPPSKDWNTRCPEALPRTSRPYFPIFRSAEISLQTLNEFLESTYCKEHWGHSSDEPDPRASIITAVEPPYSDGPAEPPLKTVPYLPKQFLGTRPHEFDAIVRSVFSCPSNENPEFNYNRYIVMDEMTEKDKTVLIIANDETEGLVVSRSDFKGALLILISSKVTS
ncbi:hypothetical protein PFICI_06735 [Pestalotiopsis fici W106-1]|uniref:Uncharacterized protein n=1 Tax=Pestalotiopsis fici (strain W106-1 / CGMCC3.15140) TaxID=1229662 RepID=W3X6K9_PESFW|nr:uncharacterized protein PFICI_06735 [Pestalotiopsis fici W106-1]ETS81733.1 hypothetical protein PFICI_06735 [Pestalotiopsis fici W106-1]